jgi:hypothetical protein
MDIFGNLFKKFSGERPAIHYSVGERFHSARSRASNPLLGGCWALERVTRSVDRKWQPMGALGRRLNSPVPGVGGQLGTSFKMPLLEGRIHS